MNWLAHTSIDELMQLKPKGFFRIATEDDLLVCTVCRPGEPVHRLLCASPGHANQMRMSLSDEGLCGFIEGAL